MANHSFQHQKAFSESENGIRNFLNETVALSSVTMSFDDKLHFKERAKLVQILILNSPIGIHTFLFLLTIGRP